MTGRNEFSKASAALMWAQAIFGRGKDKRTNAQARQRGEREEKRREKEKERKKGRERGPLSEENALPCPLRAQDRSV
jgi:hypothetical protein